MAIQTKLLPRDQIAQFMPSPRAILAFEAAQKDIISQNEALDIASFLTLNAESVLNNERALVLTSGDLVGVDAGANATYTIRLAATAVTAGGYGSASQALALAVDAKGRLTSVTAYSLNTSNITEGTNLYYTDARARSALSATAGVQYVSSTGQFSLDNTSTRNVDHAAVSVNAGAGLSGGGDLTATRTLALDTASTRNTDHAAVSVTAGTGLTGGGDLTATRTINAKSAGTYGAPTGTLSRAALASYVAGSTLTYSAAYVQAEQTATGARLATVEAALQSLSQILAALITDLKANGNLT